MLALAPADSGISSFLMLPQLHWVELLIRAVVVYVFLVVLIRITGRRQVGMMSPTDFILLLILSNAVQNSMNGGDNSLGAGLILAAVLVSLNYAMSCWHADQSSSSSFWSVDPCSSSATGRWMSIPWQRRRSHTTNWRRRCGRLAVRTSRRRAM